MSEYYKVLLVDDEDEIREGMAHRVRWNELGFEIIGTAENGVEALELVENELPDIVITDIQMPFMDGIDFVAQATAMVPTAKFIMLTGHVQFEYAQKAVSLHVEDYILKPFSAKQLEEKLTELKEVLDQEWAERRNIESLQKSYHEGLPMIRNYFLVSCFSGHITDTQVRKRAEALGLNSFGRYAIAAFQVNQRNLQSDSIFDGQEELLSFSVQRTAEDILNKYHPNQYILIFGELVVAIVEMSSQMAMTLLATEVNEICRKVMKVSNRPIVAGIGEMVPLNLLHRSLSGAEDALAYSYLLDREEIFTTYIGDVTGTLEQTVLSTEKEERDFINVIKFGADDAIEEAVSIIINKVRDKRLNPAQYQVYIIEYLTYLVKITNSYNYNLNDVFEEDLFACTERLKTESLEEMQTWLLEKCLLLNRQIRMDQIDSHKSVIQKAILYIKQNFTDPELSIEKMSGELFISPAYFSSIFKKEMQKSFVSFLTEERLNYAVKLLEETTEKTYVIAEKVGYAESNYFSYVFKKQYGVSPSKYRNQIQGA
ncbi:MAG: response regulator [Clostridiales Family XIII bacterium]|jgi:two-component system response regulator YesN|nr:response regulator [Clostridiales Family XIII bacterium]